MRCRICGSYAFNLDRDKIGQGDLCDVHYYKKQYEEATMIERERCAAVCAAYSKKMHADGESDGESDGAFDCAHAIRQGPP